MYLECRHIKSNGSKCHSPAMKDKPYCYYHLRLHRIVHKASAIPAMNTRIWRSPFSKTAEPSRSPSAKSSAPSPPITSTSNAQR